MMSSTAVAFFQFSMSPVNLGTIVFVMPDLVQTRPEIDIYAGASVDYTLNNRCDTNLIGGSIACGETSVSYVHFVWAHSSASVLSVEIAEIYAFESPDFASLGVTGFDVSWAATVMNG